MKDEIDRRLAKVQAEIAELDAAQKRPAQLAAERQRLEAEQAQRNQQRQALATHYNTTIHERHEAERQRLEAQRAALLEQYQQVRQALDALIAGVQAHDLAARVYVSECAADEAAGGSLVGRRLGPNAIPTLFDNVAWQEKHEAMLHLLTVVNCEADIERYASRHLTTLTELRAGILRRFSLEYTGRILARVPDPEDRVNEWIKELSLAGVW